MLKISRIKAINGEVGLRLEGTVGGAWVAELRAVCDELLREEKRIALDLRGVGYVDPTGAALLASLRADRRVAIKAASTYVAELLKGGAA